MKFTQFVLSLVLVMSLPSLASAGDAAAAEALFREGRALMDAGKFAAACPKLAESYAQDPATGTLLALAVCQEQAGQTASAWATYAQAAARAKQGGQLDREQAARERLAALVPKLSRLTIVVDGETAKVGGLVVKRDATQVGPGGWGTATPLDPGEHVVEASAPGKRTWQAKVTIGAVADAQTVQVPALEDAQASAPGTVPAPAASTAAPAAATDPVAAPAPAAGNDSQLRTIGLVVGGVGIVGLGVGGFFGLRAKSLNDESLEGGHCNAQNQCDSIGGAKRDDASSAASISTIAFIAGGALTATGVTLFLVGGPKDSETKARVEATPVVGRNEAAMVVSGRF